MSEVTKVLHEEAKKKIAGYIIGGIVLVIVGLFTPLWTQAAQVWNSPVVMQQMLVTLDEVAKAQEDLQDEIRALRQPSEIFEVSQANSGAIDGYCVEGEPCEMSLKIRRTQDGLRCNIVPNSTQWQFLNPRTDVVTPVAVIQKPPTRNVGIDWTVIPVTILTPKGLEPDADFFFEAFYSDCPNTIEGADPISDVSSRIPTPIYKTKPE